jgi:diguanylate cyclase (GGDEF)-like protein
MPLAEAIERMQPRDHAAAARVLSVLTIVAAAVTTISALVQLATDQISASESLASVIAGLLIVGAGWRARTMDESHPVRWAVVPFAAIVLIVVLDLATQDASVSAQAFMFFPALYGASQLRHRGAIAVTAATVFGEAAVVFPQVEFREAVISVGYVCAAIVTAAALLIAAGDTQERLVRQLKRQAAIDSLTGLVTRRVLDEAAQSALSVAASGEGTALILVDVDQFKAVNDGFGHPAGDDVLVQLADLLIRNSRRNDIVSRLGGDEIALLLPGCSESVALARAEQILAEVRANEFVTIEGKRVPISVSIGLSHAPTHANDLRSMYSTADAALYEAKRSGRDQLQMSMGETD